MKDNQQISEQEWEEIEQYLRKELLPDEMLTFSEKLATQPAFAAKVDEVRYTIEGIETAALNEKMNEFHAKIPVRSLHNKSSAKLILLKRWAVAATVIIVLGIGFLWSRPDKNERLFAAYYRPDQGLSTAMSGTDNYNFEKAMVAYKTGNYKEAIQGWQLLAVHQTTSDTLNYFLGCAYLSSQEAAKAVSSFSAVVKQEKSVFYRDACWYLGLAYLKQGAWSDAKIWLQQSDKPEKDKLLQSF